MQQMLQSIVTVLVSKVSSLCYLSFLDKCFLSIAWIMFATLSSLQSTTLAGVIMCLGVKFC